MAATEPARMDEKQQAATAVSENAPTAMAAPPAAPAPPTASTASGGSPTIAERIAATQEWLAKTPDTHYFIQLLSTDGNNVSDVQLFVDGLADKVDPQQIRVYRSRLSGRDRLGVIFGDYPTREAANSNLTRLSAINPAGNPYIRTVSKLK